MSPGKPRPPQGLSLSPCLRRGGTAPQREAPPARSSPSQNGGEGGSGSGCCGQAGIGEDGGGRSVRAGRAGSSVGLLRLGPGPVLAAGLGDAARRCHHPLGGHRGWEDPAAGEGPRGAGSCPPPPAPARCGGRESACPRRRSPAAPACPELCGGGRGPVGPVRSPAYLKAAAAGRAAVAGAPGGPGTGVSRGELASLAKRGLKSPEPWGEAAGRDGRWVQASRGWVLTGAACGALAVRADLQPPWQPPAL